MHIATKGSKIDVSSEKKLEKFAKDLSSKLKAGETIFLFGEMGHLLVDACLVDSVWGPLSIFSSSSC